MDISGEVQSSDGDGRFLWTDFEPARDDGDDGRDVVSGLSAEPKRLPPKYFYDDRGSDLFELICDQPEYYPTRTENLILEAAASEIARATGPCEMIELGSGSARKTRVLIEAYLDTVGSRSDAMRYVPVDVSGGILKSSSRALIDAYPDLEVWGLIGTYEQALDELPPRDLPARMVVFLGSTIGNMTDRESAAFVARAGHALKAGEYFLIGYDLQKPVEIVEAAYNDARGVTADFNLNMLRHLNARFDGDFDLDGFAHRAFYNRDHHRIEMHLVSAAPQVASLRSLDLEVSFDADETINTEISRKFDRAGMAETFRAAGFDHVTDWTDDNNWFAVSLFRKR